MNNTSSITSYLASVQCAGGHDATRPLLDGLWNLAHTPVGSEGGLLDYQSWSPIHEDGQRNQRMVLVFSDADSYAKPMYLEQVNAGLYDVLIAANAAKMSVSLYAPDSDCHREICVLDRMCMTCI